MERGISSYYSVNRVIIILHIGPIKCRVHKNHLSLDDSDDDLKFWYDLNVIPHTLRTLASMQLRAASLWWIPSLFCPEIRLE